jgi:hypothetical protein
MCILPGRSRPTPCPASPLHVSDSKATENSRALHAEQPGAPCRAASGIPVRRGAGGSSVGSSGTAQAGARAGRSVSSTWTPVEGMWPPGLRLATVTGQVLVVSAGPVTALGQPRWAGAPGRGPSPGLEWSSACRDPGRAAGWSGRPDSLARQRDHRLQSGVDFDGTAIGPSGDFSGPGWIRQRRS